MKNAKKRWPKDGEKARPWDAFWNAVEDYGNDERDSQADGFKQDYSIAGLEQAVNKRRWVLNDAEVVALRVLVIAIDSDKEFWSNRYDRDESQWLTTLEALDTITDWLVKTGADKL